MRPYRLLLIDHRSSHHAGPSGYGRLVDFVDAEVIPERDLSFVPWRLRRAFARRRGGSYSTTSFSKELALLGRMLEPSRGIAHFLNTEPDFHYTGWWSRALGWRTVGTFHKPPSQFASVFPEPSVLRKLDGAICVASSQVSAVKELVQHDRVWFAPHGVDTEFFQQPADTLREREQVLLFVGSHLRDFSTLLRVAELLEERNELARIVAIGPQRHEAEIPKHARITQLGDISDESLRSWYQRAAVLLMPLNDSTANGAILEGISCGTPVVVTDVGGVRDYLTSDCATFTRPGDAEAMTTAAIRIATDAALRKRMSASARKQSLRFSWPRVATRIKEIYSMLLEEQHPG